MIRQANKYDKTEIVEMMQAFRIESGIPQFKNLDNPQYWDQMLANIFAGQGIIFLAEGKGLLMGLITPSLWCNKHFVLNELAWWVKPEYRGGTVGYKLLKKYIEYGEKLKQEKRILFYTLSKLSISPSISYEKLGFTKLDENWIQ